MRSPRIAITLPVEVRAMVDRLSALTDQPASRIVADIVIEASPVMHRIADAVERVKQVNAEKSAAIRATLAHAEAEAQKTAMTALALLERIGTDGGPELGLQAQPEAPAEPAAGTARRKRHRRRPPSG